MIWRKKLFLERDVKSKELLEYWYEQLIWIAPEKMISTVPHKKMEAVAIDNFGVTLPPYKEGAHLKITNHKKTPIKVGNVTIPHKSSRVFISEGGGWKCLKV